VYRFLRDTLEHPGDSPVGVWVTVDVTKSSVYVCKKCADKKLPERKKKLVESQELVPKCDPRWRLKVTDADVFERIIETGRIESKTVAPSPLIDQLNHPCSN
jgi:ribosome-binding protein aMBF1 (putative translation factor)